MILQVKDVGASLPHLAAGGIFKVLFAGLASNMARVETALLKYQQCFRLQG